MADLASSIIRESDYAMSMRQPWDSLWQNLADYELPSMADFTRGITPGQKRGSKIVNTQGVKSARECATRINGFLTGDGTDWFGLRIPDDKIEKDPAVRAWLDQVKRIIFSVLNSPGSGFGTAKEPIYKQIVVFGNGPVYCGEGKNGWPVFRPAFLGNCAIWTDDDNRPTALFREYKQTAFGLERQFGIDALPQQVQAVLDTEPQRKFTCVHAVRPRSDSDPYDPAGKPWLEAYILKDEGNTLLANPTGYWEFPWLFPRWNVSPDEAYGRGPGEDALPDVKQLQVMDTNIIKHVHMNVDPQWLLEDEAGTSPRINQSPGGIIYGRLSPSGNWNVQRLGPTGNAAEAMELRAQIEGSVKAMFYLDAFKMVEKISDQGSVVHMSATEFAGRQAEQMRYAGPALERLRAEFLFPLLARVVAILLRNGKLPEPPWQLRGAPVYPEYVSPLAVAQRSTERSSVLQWIGDIIPLAQIDPRALDALNAQRTANLMGRVLHVPQEAFNTPEEVAAQQDKRDTAIAQQQALEQMTGGAKASKDNAQALQLLQ